MLSLSHQTTSGHPSPSPDADELADELAGLGIEELESFDPALDPGAASEDGASDGMPGGPDHVPPGVLTRDQFRDGLGAALGLAGQLTGLDTLKASPQAPTFPPAADAIYDSAADVPWLRFLIEPGNVWIGRAIAIGAFALPVAVGCQQEWRAKNAQPVRTPGADQAESESAEFREE